MSTVKLTEALTADIVGKVLRGIDPEVASVSAGISRASYFSWRKQGQDGVEPFASWWTAVARACADAEIGLVDRVATGDDPGLGFGPAKAGLELLQRRFPKRWSVQVKVEMADQLNRFIDAAARVCDAETFRKLLEALAEEPGEGEAPGASISGPAPVH